MQHTIVYSGIPFAPPADGGAPRAVPEVGDQILVFVSLPPSFHPFGNQ